MAWTWAVLRVVGFALLVLVGSCAEPALAQTKIINGQAMLPWMTGDYEKPVIIEVVGDSNATPAGGSSSPNTTDPNHFYHSITPALAKWSPYVKLGGMEASPFQGSNYGVFGGTSSLANHSTFWDLAGVTATGIQPGVATPGGSSTGIVMPDLNSFLWSSNRGDGQRIYSTWRDGAWCINDPDWYYDNRAMEVKFYGLLESAGLSSGTVLRVQRGGTEGVGEGQLSGSTNTDTSISFAGTEANTYWGAAVPAGTSAMLRVGITTTGIDETNLRAVIGRPLLRIATPTRGAPVFTSQSVGGWTIRCFDSSAGQNIAYVARFTDAALQARINYLVKSYNGTAQDVTLVFWVRLGTNDSSNDSGTAAGWDARNQLLINRYRTAAAAVGVTPHFVLDSPSDPGTLPGPNYGQAAKFDRIEAGNALTAAAMDTPSSRVIAINKRAVLNFADSGCNGTLRGPYNASTNTTGGIVDEATDVHLNPIGAEREVEAIWSAAADEWPVETLVTIDTTRRMLQDREPFFWIQLYGGDHELNPNGMNGDAYDDIRTWMPLQLARAASLGFKRVMIHTPAGKLYSDIGEYYGADQRRILPSGHETYYAGQFKTDLARFGLKADVYIGGVWEPLADPTVGRPPMLDPLIEEDMLTSQVLWWKTSVGMKRVWFDATGTYTSDATRKVMVDRTGDWCLARGLETGGEPIPIINSGGWRIDEARAYDRPWLVTESALNGFSNNANYRVPAGAVMYVVFTNNEATPARVRQRINQGFIVCAWSDTDAAKAVDMLTLQGTTSRNRTRERVRRVGHRHRKPKEQPIGHLA